MKNNLGEIGEEKAANYLISKGFELVERNYRYKRNEIDIIALKDNLLVFVEVKAKSYSAYGNPEEAVSQKQAARIIEAADQYIFEINWKKNIRFDVIAVERVGSELVISHFEDAFY